MKTIPVLLALLLPLSLHAQRNPSPQLQANPSPSSQPTKATEADFGATEVDVFARDPEEDILHLTFDINQTEVELATLMDVVAERLQLPLNVVYKNGAEKVVIHQISLRNVSLKSFLEVVTQVADVRMDLINDSKTKLAKNGVILFEAPPQRPATLNRRFGPVKVAPPHSEITLPGTTHAPIPIIPKAKPAPPEQPKHAASDPFANSENPSKPATYTRVFSLAHLDNEPDRIVEIIQTTWRVAGDVEGGEIVLHEKTSLLIIKASMCRMAEAEQVLETLATRDDRESVKQRLVLERKLLDSQRQAESRLHDAFNKIENQGELIKRLEMELSDLRSRAKTPD